MSHQFDLSMYHANLLIHANFTHALMHLVHCKRKYHGKSSSRAMGVWSDVRRRIWIIQFANDRSDATLLPIIERCCVSGSHMSILTAGRLIYNQIPNIEVRQRFKHSTEPLRKLQRSDNFWMTAKRMLKKMNGTTIAMLASHLDEYTWKQLHSKKEPYLLLYVSNSTSPSGTLHIDLLCLLLYRDVSSSPFQVSRVPVTAKLCISLISMRVPRRSGGTHKTEFALCGYPQNRTLASR